MKIVKRLPKETRSTENTRRELWNDVKNVINLKTHYKIKELVKSDIYQWKNHQKDSKGCMWIQCS